MLAMAMATHSLSFSTKYFYKYTIDDPRIIIWVLDKWIGGCML